jgi:hypothetical protein
MSHINGPLTRYTAGTVVIEQVANGFIVTLPPVKLNPYEGLAPEMGQALSSVTKESFETDLATEVPERGYDMSPITNVFIFKAYSQVISFLEKRLKPVVITE